MKSLLRALATLGLFSFADLAVVAAAEPQDEGDWSPPRSGMQARFSLSESHVSHQTRIQHVVLELRNVSDLGNPLCLLYDPTKSLAARLFDSQGKPVPTQARPASIMSPRPFLICLPVRSTLRFDVTAYGYGVRNDEGTFIGLHSGDWVIEKGDASAYSLGGTFTARRPAAKTEETIWTGSLDIPRAKLRVRQAVPKDAP